jgi:hypothetical protein
MGKLVCRSPEEKQTLCGPAVFWKNELYAVAVYDEQDGITHITVQRLDGTPARDWRHLQQIKNEVIGPEREAVELYPAQSRVVDLTNTTHLWVFPEGVQVPFGMTPLPPGVALVITTESSSRLPDANSGPRS